MFCLLIEATGTAPGTPHRASNTGPKTSMSSSLGGAGVTIPKRNSTKVNASSNITILNKPDIVPVIVPRTSTRLEPATEPRKEIDIAGRTMPFSLQSKTTDFRKFVARGDDIDRPTVTTLSETAGSKAAELGHNVDRNIFSGKGPMQGISVAERNPRDRYIVSSKSETMSMSESPADNQEDRCTYAKVKHVASSFMFHFWSCLSRIINRCYASLVACVFLCYLNRGHSKYFLSYLKYKTQLDCCDKVF